MDEKRLILKLRTLLGPARFKHCLRVRDKVEDLARYHHVNLKHARIAGLLHDVARYLDRKGMLNLAKKLKYKIDNISRLEPKLLHARLSADIAKKDFGIKDKGILNAISKHTLGSTNMSTLDKIIYVADHTEEGRTHAGVEKARTLAKKDLDQSIVAISGSMIQYLTENELPVHPMTVEVRNHYLLKKFKKK